MDFLKSQLDRIQRQLNGLSATQKMLTAALVAIMVMTMVMWGRFAGTADMTPVLNQPLSDDDVSRIVSVLDARGIPHKSDGTRLLVPSDRRMEALAHMGYEQVLPKNFASGFEEVIKQMSPWDSPSKTDEMWKRAKELTLSQLIGGFPNVKSAVVMVDQNQRRNISNPNGSKPSASITVFMQGTADAPQQLVDAAADVVCGATANLTRDRVKVNVNGRPRRVRGAEGDGAPGATERLEVMAAAEARLQEKVERQFSYIPGLLVQVAVEVKGEASEARSVEYDPEKVAKALTRERERTNESTTGGSAPGEPGVVPNVGGANVGADVNDPGLAAGAGNVTTESETETESENKFSEKTTVTRTPWGGVTPVSASVRVPRSYFVTALRNTLPQGTEPDAKTVQALIDEELPKIKMDVRNCTNLPSEDVVTIATYLDVLPPSFAAAPADASASMVTKIGGYTKEIAVGALAVVSLFMVMMMVRKGSPAPVAVAAPGASPAPAVLEPTELIAGEVGGSDAALDGVELDDEAIRTQQVLEQVGTLVSDNPDAAANLVKRWLNRS